MPPAHWELIPHGADMGVRGVGTSKAEAFEQAAMALMAVITDPNSVVTRERVDIVCSASDDELLLVDWLNALIYEMATRKMLFAHFEVNIGTHDLWAEAWGERIDIDRHEPAVEVKGATCTALRVAEDQTGHWIAQCVVDV
jgi:SHS2 domain-containing protein